MVALTISIHILFNMNLTFSFINFLWGFWLRLLDGGALWAAVHGVAEGQTRLSEFTFTFHFHALEKEMVTHSSILAWRIPGMGEPGGLLFMGSHRVGHDWSDLAATAAAASESKKCIRSYRSCFNDPFNPRVMMYSCYWLFSKGLCETLDWEWEDLMN